MEKISILTIAGLFASLINRLYGGFDNFIFTLMLCMCADYITGLMLAGFFKKSLKTSDGRLESRAGFKGLIRKFSILILVLIGVRLDIILNVSFIKNAIIISFIANEILSIIENVGIMGVPVPDIIKKAVTVLNSKGENNEF